MTLLAIGLFALVGLLVAIAIDATALQLRRTELWQIADAAALAGADAIDDRRYYDDGVRTDGGLPLRERHVWEAAQRHLALAGETSGLRPRLTQARAITHPGGRQGAEVTVSARVRLPLAGTLLGAWDGVTITASAHARSRAALPAATPPATPSATPRANAP